MPILPLRALDPAASATDLYDRWLGELGEALERGADRDELCRRTLTGLFHPQWAEADPAESPTAHTPAPDVPR